MARIYSPLGVIKGSVGNLTFSGGASDNQIRTKIATNTSNTVGQQEVRHRFAELAMQFSKLKAVFAIGFRKLGKLSPYNRYLQTNYEYTSVDQDLVASIDYPQMVVSAGGVLGVAGLTATVVAGGVAFTWQVNSNGTTGLATDVPHMVVVHKSTGESYSAYGSTRDDGSETIGGLPITAANKGDYAAYLYFERADGSDASPSTYHAIA